MEKPTQLSSGNWRQRFTGPDGKRHSTTDTSARKVQKQAALELAEMVNNHGKKKERERGLTRFDIFAETWLHMRRPGQPDGYSPGGYYKQQKRLAILIKTFGTMHIEEITPAEVREWWNDYSHAPCARRDIYGLMKQILAVALDDELISRSPCRIKDASKAMAKPRPTFTEADIAALYFATENARDRALLTLLSGTAARIGEAVALDWDDISFLDRKANVERHLTPWGMQEGTKSHETGSRLLALPTWLTDELEGLYRESEGTGPIFRNQRGGRLSIDTAERMFRKLRIRAGLPNMHLHDIRHVSLTTYARQPGVTLKDIMARGGHKSTKVAMAYQHTDTQRDEAMVSTLPNPMMQRQK
jgi:integrase